MQASELGWLRSLEHLHCWPKSLLECSQQATFQLERPPHGKAPEPPKVGVAKRNTASRGTRRPPLRRRRHRPQARARLRSQGTGRWASATVQPASAHRSLRGKSLAEERSS